LEDVDIVIEIALLFLQTILATTPNSAAETELIDKVGEMLNIRFKLNHSQIEINRGLLLLAAMSDSLESVARKLSKAHCLAWIGRMYINIAEDMGDVDFLRVMENVGKAIDNLTAAHAMIPDNDNLMANVVTWIAWAFQRLSRLNFGDKAIRSIILGLETVPPDSWLFTDLLRRLDEMFLGEMRKGQLVKEWGDLAIPVLNAIKPRVVGSPALTRIETSIMQINLLQVLTAQSKRTTGLERLLGL
jgi:hypothetical protein